MSVSLQAIQKYESGENRLSISRLYLAARAMGMTLSSFMEGIEGCLIEAKQPSPCAGDGSLSKSPLFCDEADNG